MAGSGTAGDLAFLFQPAVQAAERLEAGGGRAGAVPGEQVAEERLGVLATDVEQVPAAGGEE